MKVFFMPLSFQFRLSHRHSNENNDEDSDEDKKIRADMMAITVFFSTLY